MHPPTILFFIFLLIVPSSSSSSSSSQTTTSSFIFNGFASTDLRTDGISKITSNGLLRLTDATKQDKGHSFYPSPLPFRNSSTGQIFSFSSTFIFAIRPQYQDLSGHGIAFVLSHSDDFSQALPSQYLGLFNTTDNDNNSSDQIIAVELDTNYTPEFGDIDNNHIGIDANSLKSLSSSHASYFSDQNGGGFKNLSLVSGDPMQVWIDYDQFETLVNVTISPASLPKPTVPLLSSSMNLSALISGNMYVGFSSSTGSFPTFHYILGWSFSINGKAQELDLSRLPLLPRINPKHKPRFLIFGLPVIFGLTLLITVISVTVFMMRREHKFSEVMEDWEVEYGPQRFSYKDLYTATNGFKEKELLGVGGFGKVYNGILPKKKLNVAVKRISHESRQGMKEFIAEIVSIGRVRHRNLVQLLGYCRRQGELLLVYEFMSNGSLDKLLFDKPKSMLHWEHGFRIIKRVASGIHYLHKEWDQVVIHRDIKANNVLLDEGMNGRLGDFGLSRLYDHGSDPRTTRGRGIGGILLPSFRKVGNLQPKPMCMHSEGLCLKLHVGGGQ